LADLARSVPDWDAPDGVKFIYVRVRAKNWTGDKSLAAFIRFWDSLPVSKCRALIVGIFFVYRELDGDPERQMRNAAGPQVFQGLTRIQGLPLQEFSDADADDVDDWLQELFDRNVLDDREVELLKRLQRPYLERNPSMPLQDLIAMLETSLAQLRELGRKAG
jgi:hypothetical protein